MMSGVNRRSSRRSSVSSSFASAMPPTSGRTAGKAKAAAAGTEDAFVSGELFNFKFRSPKGIMTRARRSSIYVAEGSSSKLAPKVITAKRSAPHLSSICEGDVDMPRTTKTKAKPGRTEKVKSGAATGHRWNKAPALRAGKPDDKSNKNGPPPKEIRARGPSSSLQPKRSNSVVNDSICQDVQVVLQKLKNSPIKTQADPKIVLKKLELLKGSPKRVQMVCKDLLKEAAQENVENDPVTPESVKRRRTPAPMSSKRITRSSRKAPNVAVIRMKKFSPAQVFSPKLRKVAPITAPVFYGTPQSTNPSALLKHSLKSKVQEKMEERIAALPPSSPYALLEGETESGSPSYLFTKLHENPKSAKVATKYLTATPGVNVNRVRGALRSIGNSMDSRSEKLALPLGGNNFESPQKQSIASRIDDSSPGSPKSPGQQPQFVTGELARICSIM